MLCVVVMLLNAPEMNDESDAIAGYKSLSMSLGTEVHILVDIRILTPSTLLLLHLLSESVHRGRIK